MNHKVAEEIDKGWWRVNTQYEIRLRCTCGQTFRGLGRTKRNATINAEKTFREHIPIR